MEESKSIEEVFCGNSLDNAVVQQQPTDLEQVVTSSGDLFSWFRDKIVRQRAQLTQYKQFMEEYV